MVGHRDRCGKERWKMRFYTPIRRKFIISMKMNARLLVKAEHIEVGLLIHALVPR